MTTTLKAGLTLTGQQAEAAEKITTWYEQCTQHKTLTGSVGAGAQVFRLFGYAGTGKTSIARQIIDDLGVADVIFAAFTGKAAYVLRTKGCPDARTIHSLIYLPAEKARARLRELKEQLEREEDPRARDNLTKQVKLEERKLESPDWILRDPDECDLSTADLLVIDEVSMVGEAMAHDLLSYDVPTLVLGDPAQLPPVEGGGYFIDAEPNHLLTEIHRSALDSPVTRLATAVRGSTVRDHAYGIPDPDGDSGRVDGMRVDDLLGYDQVLVGTNATRWQAIHLLRALRGQVGGLPVPGDRVIAMANSGAAEVFNGQQFYVLATTAVPDRDDRITLTVVDDEGGERNITTWTAGFTGLEGEKQAKRDGRGAVAAMTFGHAITTHKSQGSQWDNVMVVDEAGVFASIEAKEAARLRRQAGLPDRGEATEAGHRAGQRWLYTAITRAAKRVTIVPRLQGIIR